MMRVLVDGAAGLALEGQALEGGLKLYLRTLSHNVLRADAQRRGLGRAHSDGSGSGWLGRGDKDYTGRKAWRRSWGAGGNVSRGTQGAGRVAGRKARGE
jgi:hypothetical protein